MFWCLGQVDAMCDVFFFCKIMKKMIILELQNNAPFVQHPNKARQILN